MTPEDRELLLSLRQQHQAVQQSLDRLQAQLAELEARANGAHAPSQVTLPPLPTEVALNEAPLSFEVSLPPLPQPEPLLPPLPPSPSPVPVPGRSLEFQFGRWLTRIGAVFFVLFLISADGYFHLHRLLGPWGKFGLGALISLFFIVVGQRLERKKAHLLFFGRTVTAAGLAGLYVTFYAAGSFAGLQVIRSPLLEGLLLLWWSAYVFVMAERKKSQLLALFAITLAYISTALNPLHPFTMAADLILAATAVIFLLRNGWATLSYFALLGTYLAFLRQLIMADDGELVLDTSRTLHFWPHAIYLMGAWLIFTAAVFFSTDTSFRGAKRLVFLTLNNGALAGLLALTAYIAGYGYGAVGGMLLDTGFVLLITSRIVGWVRMEPEKVMAAYAAQGLALVTAGIMVVYTGLTRGVLLLLETLLLGVAGAFARDRVLTVSTYFAGFFATLFLIWEIGLHAHYPWLLGWGGAAVMLMNAWWARADIRHGPEARHTVVPAAAGFSALALGLIFIPMAVELSASALPPALAFVALALTFSVYFTELYELPPLSQILLLIAQGLVLFPVENGEELPWWSTFWVAVVTLLLLTWWTRQQVTRSGPWTIALTFLYALALAGLAYQTVRPYVDTQGWMISASLLSLAFLVYGAFSRVWPIAAIGQLFLAVAVSHFFLLPNPGAPFPWTWSAAAVPLVVVFATACATHNWLRLFSEIPESVRGPFNVLAYGYQLLALGMVVRLVFAQVPALDQISMFLFLGTLMLSWNVRHPSAFGVRCSFVLSAIGMILYLGSFRTDAHTMATFLNGLAFLVFLAQPALLRQQGQALVTKLESWALILFSVGTGWIFVSYWVWTRSSSGYLTMSWALYALFLFLFGQLVGERRFRWCGLAILVVAILSILWTVLFRLGSLSSGSRVLTFVVLTVISLGLGYLILRFADRDKKGP